MLDQTSAGRGDARQHARLRPVHALIGALLVAPTVAGCSGSADGDEPAARAGTRPAQAGQSGLTGEAGEAGQAGQQEGAEPADVDEQAAEVELPLRTRTAVRRATGGYLDESGDALRTPDTEQPPTSYDDVTGPALETLLNTVAEYEQNGWRVVGRPRVVSQQVIRTEGRTAVVRACLDNSRVRVLDVDGKVVPNSRPAAARTLNILTLTRTKDGWAVSDQRPATRPNC